MKRVVVYVVPKEGVLDPQGQAIQSSLKLIGFDDVSGVRYGKYIELDMVDPTPDRVTQLCEKLLANTVIEDFRFEIQDKN